MVMICPSQAKLILPRFLELGGAIFPRPVFPLGSEENIAGDIDAEIGDRRIGQAIGFLETVFILLKYPPAGAELLGVFQEKQFLTFIPGWGILTAISMTF